MDGVGGHHAMDHHNMAMHTQGNHNAFCQELLKRQIDEADRHQAQRETCDKAVGHSVPIIIGVQYATNPTT